MTDIKSPPISNPISEPIFGNMEEQTINNKHFRNVIYTSRDKEMQLVLMSLKPNEEIGMEVHPNVDQFFRVESGHAKAVVNNKEIDLPNNSFLVVPKGTQHNIINIGQDELKLYTIYTPANHPPNTKLLNKPVEDMHGGGYVNYEQLYRKYKSKYLELKRQIV